jgi:hypothetical protein
VTILLMASGVMCAGVCVAADEARDLALLRIEGPPVPPPVRYPGLPAAGFDGVGKVVCVGNPSERGVLMRLLLRLVACGADDAACATHSCVVYSCKIATNLCVCVCVWGGGYVFVVWVLVHLWCVFVRAHVSCKCAPLRPK